MPIAHFVRISFACVAIPNKNKTYKMGYGFADSRFYCNAKNKTEAKIVGLRAGITG